jgi:hypothetical protein
MSTKTTFKRIALVAVAALGLSLVAVAPSQAANSADVMTLGATASAATTAVATSTTVSLTGVSDATPATATLTAVLISAPLTSTAAAILPVFTYTAAQVTANTAANASASGTGTAAVVFTPGAAGRFTGSATLTVTPDVAGTYVYRITPSGSVFTTTAQTWTVTATSPTVKSIKAYLNTDTTTASTADASSLSYTAASSVTTKGALVVQQYSTTDTTTVATTLISEAVTVTISKGLVSKTNDFFAGAKSVTTAAGGSTAGRSEYYVFANGEVGSATLTVTVGALTSTKTITFQGVAKTLSAALTSGQPTWISPTVGSNNTTTVTVTAKDEAGNAASNTTTITATPASTAVATATVNGLVVTITGVAAGTTVITIADAATTSPAASTTYTVTVAPVQSATLPTLTFDKAEYLAGELMTITVAAGAADNSAFVAFTAAPTVSVNVVTTTNPFASGTTGTVALVGGKATWKAYAPITPGPVVITATSSTGSSVTSAAGNVTATATVISDGVAQAAVDAAAEAIDAANAATDAANAAAEAADAATAAAQDAADAVAALSVSVAAMIDSLKKQITALTNLVIKIQKKVKA